MVLLNCFIEVSCQKSRSVLSFVEVSFVLLSSLSLSNSRTKGCGYIRATCKLTSNYVTLHVSFFVSIFQCNRQRAMRLVSEDLWRQRSAIFGN